jgi:recombinational DNA repair ATPase RecF
VHISTKLRELHQLASTERRRKAVEEELSALHPAVTAVEITGQASKGQTLIHLALKTEGKAKIAHVLSDGEQRALALAFFLAEIAVSDDGKRDRARRPGVIRSITSAASTSLSGS